MTGPVETHRTAETWTPSLETFGARLALVRQKMGWNVKEAAVACGLPPESWRRWERDGLEPRRLVTIAMTIASATRVDYLWLVHGPSRGAVSGPEITVGDFIGAGMLTPHPSLLPRVIPRQRARHGDGRKRTSSIPRSPILDKPTLLTGVGAQ